MSFTELQIANARTVVEIAADGLDKQNGEALGAKFFRNDEYWRRLQFAMWLLGQVERQRVPSSFSDFTMPPRKDP